MFSFVSLLRTVYSFTRNGQLDPVSVMNALLSKEPYHELSKILLTKYLESPNTLHLVHDVNFQDPHGWSLVHFAAYTKNLQLMQTCIKNNANLMITDYNGNTVLHIAIQVAQKNKSTAQCLASSLETIENENQNEEYLKIVELVLKKANTASITNEQRQLHFNSNSDNHCLRGIADEQKLNQEQPNLLVNRQNVFGKTALHYACFLKPDQFSIKILTLLLHAKANADIPDHRHCTPIYYLLAEHQSEHRSKNRPKKCSKNCSERSPFIDLLTTKYKCDRLNLDEFDYGISSLQNKCRKTIQQHSSTIQSLQILPVSLCTYLSRRTL